MMHRFEWVGRNCVHKVPLNCLNPRGAAEWVRAKFRGTACTQFLPTHKINLCIICFIEWAPKSVKKGKISINIILPDAWKNYASGNYWTHGYEKKNRASGNYRMHGYEKKIMRPVYLHQHHFTGCMEKSCVR